MMSPDTARKVFSRGMQLAQRRALTATEKRLLARARQVLRRARRPASNPQPTLEQAVELRMQELREVLGAGYGKLTGKAIRDPITGEVTGRFRGVKPAFPELKHVKEAPGVISKALERGSGPLFDDVRSEVTRFLGRYYKAARPRRPRKPTVPPHKALRSYCKHCHGYHSKGEHAAHGEGAFHRTHLFSFNPSEKTRSFVWIDGKKVPVETLASEKIEERPTLGQDAAEAERFLYGGRRPEQLREGKQFDKTRLEDSPLFRGKGPQKGLFDNPALEYLGRIDELRYVRDWGRQPGFYKHKFTSRAFVYRAPNGDIVVRRARR